MPKAFPYSDMPTYVVWGPVMLQSIIEFIERAGWKPDDTMGYWTHERAPGSHGFLQAFEITSDWLFDIHNP